MVKRADLPPLLALACLVFITYHHSYDTTGVTEYAAPQQYSHNFRNPKIKRKANATIFTEYTIEGEIPDSNIQIPPFFNNLADLTDKTVPNDIAFLWHIPRAGGSTLKEILGNCLDLVLASDGGGDGKDLRVTRIGGAKYINIDATTSEGVERAKSMGAAKSGMIDVVISPGFITTTTMFGPKARGKLFVMFRHPVDRAVSKMYASGYANWKDGSDTESIIFQIQECARMGVIENNWMVRSLVDKMDGYLTFEDLDLAKEILRRKCLVGLMKEKEESIKRFQRFNYWEHRSKLAGIAECEEKYMQWAWPKKIQHPVFEEGSEAYDLLKSKNELDMELYKYAQILFEQQYEALGLHLEQKNSATIDDMFAKVKTDGV